MTNVGSPGGSDGKESACNIKVWFLGWEEPLEKGMSTHSSILDWKIPWTEKPGGVQPIGLWRVTISACMTNAQLTSYSMVKNWKLPFSNQEQHKNAHSCHFYLKVFDVKAKVIRQRKEKERKGNQFERKKKNWHYLQMT